MTPTLSPAVVAELERLCAADSPLDPARDRCRPRGIVIDRALCPPEDRLTEMVCALGRWV